MLSRMPDNIGHLKAPEFPRGFAWLNIARPLSIGELKGNVVVLDFWTYCCINCMHTLPSLDWLEKKYHNRPVMFIGIHSAKFTNEKQVQNVQEAVSRYEISHPVVVDQDMKIWRSYGVTAWPTVIIIDPKGNIIYQQAGEANRDEIDDIIAVLLAQHATTGTLAKEPVLIEHSQKRPKRMLSYPGKLSFSPDGKMLAVSDSNHNRILIIDSAEGNIIHKIGGASNNLSDGTFDNASFSRPQGLAWSPTMDKLYVADTENHALREIDFSEKIVRTLAGDGKQGGWISGARESKETQLNSPWDLVHSDGFLFIAMAGLHQIWAYDIQSGKIGPFAGNGYENIVDGSFADAQFAQPSGLTVYGNFMLVADSEVSAIRLLDLRKKTVQTVVGEGLFEFGHVDGPLANARMQHPLGVHCAGNKIYVADTYNHAIRLIDLDTQKVSTLVGDSDATNNACKIQDTTCDTLGLFEPSDVKQQNGKTLFIADTNNHLIRTFDLDNNVLGTFLIKDSKK
jgi:thiol-disulfide isomerase/thioredoxin